MDISEMRREADAFRKRKQDAEIAEMEGKIAALKVKSRELDAEFLKLAEACYVMTLTFAGLARFNPRMAILAWYFGILTKGSLMMMVEEPQHAV